MNKEIKLKIKGIKGDTPTDEQLVELIKPLIPEPLKGDVGPTPTDEKLVELITPLIPEPKTPSDEKLIGLIKPLIILPEIKEQMEETSATIVSKINKGKSLIEKNKIDVDWEEYKNKETTVEDVKGLPETIRQIQHRVAGYSQVAGGGTNITLKTNDIANTIQTELNLKAGTNITLTPDTYGAVTIGATGGGTPAGSTPDVQINNGGVFGAIPSHTGSIAKVLTQVDGEVPTWEYPEITTNLTFMFTNVASDIATYLVAKDLPNYVIGAIQTITTVGVSTTPTLLATFATQTGYPNKTVIPVGIFHFHFETEKVAGANNYYCYTEVYKRDTGGTETLLVTSDITTQTAINTVVQQTMTAVNTTADVIDATDRIVVKVYAVMLSSTATIKLYIDDNTDARFEMPSTSTSVPNLQDVTDMGSVTTNSIEAQLLKANRLLIGDVIDDTTSYAQVAGTTKLNGSYIEIDPIVATGEEIVTAVQEVAGTSFNPEGFIYIFQIYPFKDTVDGRVYSSTNFEFNHQDSYEGIATFSISDGGSGNNIGDILYVDSSVGNAYIKVTGVSGGAVTSATLLASGTYYTTGISTCYGDFGATGTCEIDILTLLSPPSFDLLVTWPAVTGATGYKIILYDNTNAYYYDHSIETATNSILYTGAGVSTDLSVLPASPYYYTSALETFGPSVHQNIITDAFRSSDSDPTTDLAGFAWGEDAYAAANSFAQGFHSSASGGYDIALGGFAIASGGASVAIGGSSVALANSSLAMMQGQAEVTGSIAIGGKTKFGGFLALGNTGAYAYADKAMVIGDGRNQTASSIYLGSPNQQYPYLHMRPLYGYTSTNFTVTNPTSLSSEKITNGTFNTNATGWTLGAGFSYDGANQRIAIATTNTSSLTQTSAAMATPIVIGETYLLTFVGTLSEGNFQITCGGNTLSLIQVGFSQPFEIFTATSTADLKFQTSSGNTSGWIDTISLKKITAGDINACGNLLGTDVKATGRVTEQGTFAEIYVADGSTAQSIPTGATYTKLTAFTTNGSSSNCTADATNNKITVTKAGKYLVNCTVSGYDGATGAEFKMALFKAGTEQNNIHATNKFNVGSEIDNMDMCGIIVATANQDIDVRLRHDQVGSVNFTTQYANLTINYLGE